MAVRRKPQPRANDTPPTVEDFIASGGTDAQETPAPPDSDEAPSVQPVKLRVPTDLLADIDAAVARRRPRISRHQWILEAIVHKLELDQQS